MGSIAAVTDATGQVITRFRYDPWGKQTLISGSNTGIDQTRQGHTGHEMLDGGLTHMNGRLYDPVLARFVSADPNINDEYNLQSFNRYSYVLNNPLYYTDPTGFMEFSDGGSWGGGSFFSLSGGSSSGISFSFGSSSSWGGSGGSGSRSSFFSSGGTGVSQSSIGSSGFYSNSNSLTGNNYSFSQYNSVQGGNSWSANNYSWSGSNFGNGVGDPTYSSVLSSRSTMDGVGRTQGEIWAAQGASRNLAMGFMPGYDLYQATQNNNAGFADYAVGILGIAPGFGKGAGLGVKGLDEGWGVAKETAPLWSATKSKSAAENAFRHFKDHGADFGAQNAVDYTRKAQDFLRNPSADVLSKTRANGDMVRFDPTTNAFGVIDKHGAPRTFYKPDPAKHGYPTNLDYFNAQ